MSDIKKLKTKSPTQRAVEICDRLENVYDFRCEGRSLKDCADWQELRRVLERDETRRVSTANPLVEFASSSNGDRWFLARDANSGASYVVHKANKPSGGAVTHIGVEDFLGRKPAAPEQQALEHLLNN